MQSDLAPTFPRAHTPTLFTWLIRFAYTSASMAVIFASLGVIGAAAFNLSYSDRIYPGVRALGIDLSGMTAAEAAVALSGAFTYPQSPAFTFHEGEHAWTATPAELGVALNLHATVNAAYAVGRSGNILADWLDQFEAWYFGWQIAPVVTYDESHTLAYLKQLGEVFFQPTREASLVAEGAKVTATPGQIGRQLDVIATATVLRASIMRLAPADMSLQYAETPPLVLDASAQAAAAEAILRQPLVLAVANPAPGDPTGWTIDQEALGAMLHIRRVEDGPNAAQWAWLAMASYRPECSPRPCTKRSRHHAGPSAGHCLTKRVRPSENTRGSARLVMVSSNARRDGGRLMLRPAGRPGCSRVRR